MHPALIHVPGGTPVSPEEIDLITRAALAVPEKLEVATGWTRGAPTEVFIRRPGEDVAVASEIINPQTGEPDRALAEFFVGARATILQLRGALLAAQGGAAHWKVRAEEAGDALAEIQRDHAPELNGENFHPGRLAAALRTPDKVAAGATMFFKVMEVAARQASRGMARHPMTDPVGMAVASELTEMVSELAKVRFPDLDDEG